VRIDEQTLDQRLQLLDHQRDASATINPSLLIKDNEVIVVARRHRRETKMGNGIFNGPEGAQDAVIIDQLWHSDIIMGKTPLDPIAWKEWPTTGVNPLQNVQMEEWSGLRTPSGNEWKDLCVVETWIASNNTLIRHVVTGPEDPKAVDLEGQLVMAFDSKKPHSGDVEGVCRRNQQGLLDAVTQMYVSSDVQVTQPTEEKMGYRLSYGQIDVDEKTAPLRLHAHAARYFVGGGGRQQREDLQHQLRTAAEGGPGISTCQDQGISTGCLREQLAGDSKPATAAFLGLAAPLRHENWALCSSCVPIRSGASLPDVADVGATAIE